MWNRFSSYLQNKVFKVSLSNEADAHALWNINTVIHVYTLKI